MASRRLAFLVGIVMAVASACKPASSPEGAASITVTSSSFAAHGMIPGDLTCDGADTSPALTFSSMPERTASLAVILDDPDAPVGTFTHWLVYDLPPDLRSLAAGVDPTTLGARIGKNDFGKNQYNGPCPPARQIHRYHFRVFALDAPLGLRDGADRGDVDAAMRGHVLGSGDLVASFGH